MVHMQKDQSLIMARGINPIALNLTEYSIEILINSHD
jgi:hypothetical protein